MKLWQTVAFELAVLMGPAGGGAQLSGFSRHMSYFTDARGTGVRRSGRIPITNFANTTFPDARNGAAAPFSAAQLCQASLMTVWCGHLKSLSTL